jgi:hypothetical protein
MVVEPCEALTGRFLSIDARTGRGVDWSVDGRPFGHRPAVRPTAGPGATRRSGPLSRWSRGRWCRRPGAGSGSRRRRPRRCPGGAGGRRRGRPSSGGPRGCRRCRSCLSSGGGSRSRPGRSPPGARFPATDVVDRRPVRRVGAEHDVVGAVGAVRGGVGRQKARRVGVRAGVDEPDGMVADSGPVAVELLVVQAPSSGCRRRSAALAQTSSARTTASRSTASTSS